MQQGIRHGAELLNVYMSDTYGEPLSKCPDSICCAPNIPASRQPFAGCSLSVLVLLAVMVTPYAASADYDDARSSYQKGQFEKAAQQFRQSAELGHPDAQFNLGAMYMRGEGLPKNADLAFAWIFLAAESEVPDSRAMLDKIKPELSAKALNIIQDLRTRYGKAAIAIKLLPVTVRGSSVAGPAQSEASQSQYSGDWAANEADQKLLKNSMADCRFDAKNVKQAIDTGQQYTRQVVVGFNEFAAVIHFAADGSARVVEHVFTYPRKYLSRDEYECFSRARISPLPPNDSTRRTIFSSYHTGGGQWGNNALNMAVTPTQITNRLGSEILPCALDGSPACQYLAALMPFNDSDRGMASQDMLLRSAQGGYALAQYAYAIYALGSREEYRDQMTRWLELAQASRLPAAAVALARLAITRTPTADWLAAKILLEQANAVREPRAVVPLAALLAAAPDSAVRAPGKVAELIDKARIQRGSDPTVLEITAAAAAARGDFKAAIAAQDDAIKVAKQRSWNTELLDKRRATYEAGKPWFGDLLAIR